MFIFLPKFFGGGDVPTPPVTDVPISSDKQVPIYQGMTVSNDAPVAESVRAFEGDAVSMLNSPYIHKNSIVLLGNGNGNGNGKKDNIDVNGAGPYYAQKNEDIYIHVHIFNPDEFEILSFTLNDVKYSSYMFEKGSDLETLILKYNVGDIEGVQQYTIDAIKYVDGDRIKDVKMEGEKTIEVIVGSDNSVINFNAKFVGWDMVIEPTWKSSFEGEKTILSLAVYEGDTKIKDLDPADTVIKGLRAGKRLFLVATYPDGEEVKTVKYIFDTPKQSEGLHIVGGVVTGIGTCSDEVLYIDMPIGDWAFSDNKMIKEVYLGYGVTSIGERAFGVCESLKSVTISEGITAIAGETFISCKNLEKVNIPQGVTSIGNGAFHSCKNLSEVVISEGVKTIKNDAFGECRSLTKITLPSTLETIEIYAFSHCMSLTSITMSNGVKYIGEMVFMACPELKEIDFNGTVSEWEDIEKEAYWKEGTNSEIFKVICTDGEFK